MTHNLLKALVVVWSGAFTVVGQAASAEAIFEFFDEVCLQTANQPNKISAKMEKLADWEAVSTDEQVVLKELANNHTWLLQSDMELGIVVAGSIPQETGFGSGVCMLAMPRHELTADDASKFLLELGGLHAEPSGKGGDDNDVFFAFLLDGNWMMVGIHLIPAGTHLQFLLADPSDDDVKIAVGKAKAEDYPAK